MTAGLRDRVSVLLSPERPRAANNGLGHSLRVEGHAPPQVTPANPSHEYDSQGYQYDGYPMQQLDGPPPASAHVHNHGSPDAAWNTVPAAGVPRPHDPPTHLHRATEARRPHPADSPSSYGRATAGPRQGMPAEAEHWGYGHEPSPRRSLTPLPAASPMTPAPSSERRLQLLTSTPSHAQADEARSAQAQTGLGFATAADAYAYAPPATADRDRSAQAMEDEVEAVLAATSDLLERKQQAGAPPSSGYAPDGRATGSASRGTLATPHTSGNRSTDAGPSTSRADDLISRLQDRVAALRS